MIQAETVTFGGSALDRGAEVRADAAALATLWRGGRVLALWKGRVLTAGETAQDETALDGAAQDGAAQDGAAQDGAGLGWLKPGHPVLTGGLETSLFLGRDEAGRGYFAQDVSSWVPQAPVTAQPGFFDASRQPHPALPEPWAFTELRAVMAALSPREAELAATARGLAEWHRTHGFCAACGAASAPSHGGWQRLCPACKASHFPRTDPVVIMLVERGNLLLLGRGPTWPEKMFSCLAGFVEPGETIEAAVRREVFEETGIRCGKVRYLASQPWPFPASLMLGCRTEALPGDLHLDPAEIAEARWVSREQMVTVFAGQNPDIRPPRLGAIAQFLIAGWLADRLD
jgi:NAD+ diphosphatase